MRSELSEKARAAVHNPARAETRQHGLINYPLLVAVRRRSAAEPSNPGNCPSGMADLAVFRGIMIAVSIAVVFWASTGLLLWLLFR